MSSASISIWTSSPTRTPPVVDVALAKLGLVREVVLRLPHFLMAPAVVASTDLVAALDRRVAEPFSRLFPLKLLPPPLPLPGGKVGQVWHDRTHTSPPHAWLRGRIAALAKSL
ncbi:MAG: hypothetical protein IPI67_15325 [Myxococcales bacterium]|nr:hypothetical protein [Myxococcales bacterium]